jgi:hypothetical protein
MNELSWKIEIHIAQLIYKKYGVYLVCHDGSVIDVRREEDEA